MRAVGLVTFAAVALIIPGFLLYAIFGQRQTGTAVASPTPTATVTLTARPTATTTPTPSLSATGPTTSPEQLADRLGDALEASDFERLRALIDPAGFFYQHSQTGGVQPITADQAIDLFKRNSAGGTLHVQVQRRPIRPRTGFQPVADDFITSTWMQYEGLASERVDLMLKNETGGWFWSGVLINAPPQ